MKKKKTVLKILGIVFVLYVIYVLVGSMFPRFVFPSSSMEPTIKKESYGWGSKPAYWFKDPKRFDIVAFRVPEHSRYRENALLVFRIVGLPGEIIELKDDVILIDGKEITYPEGLTYQSVFVLKEIKDFYNKMILKEDEYYLLGDNFTNSMDSRDFGPVERADIFAKIIKYQRKEQTTNKAGERNFL